VAKCILTSFAPFQTFPTAASYHTRFLRFIRFLAQKGLQKHDCRMGKRTTSVTVKMSAEDYALLTKAAENIWPGAIMTRSSVVLGLARIGAEAVLSKKRPK